MECFELVCHVRALCDQEVDGWNGEEKCYTVSCVVLEELREVEAWHPVNGTAHVEGVDEVALDASNVSNGEVGDGAVLERGVGGRDPGFEDAAWDDSFGDEVAVREFDAWSRVLISGCCYCEST